MEFKIKVTKDADGVTVEVRGTASMVDKIQEAVKKLSNSEKWEID